MSARLGGSQRLIAAVLVGLGVFLLVSAILLPLYTIPKLKKLPLDYDAVQVSEGSGSFLDASALLAGEGEDAMDDDIALRQQLYVTVEDPANADVATLQGGLTLSRGDTTPGRGLLNASIDRVTVDRATAMPTNDPVGSLQTDRERPAAELPREGLQYKFPYGAEKQSYPYFDLTSRTTADIEFVEETTLDGVTVYHYRQELEPVDMFVATRDTANRVGLPRGTWGLAAEGDENASEILFMNRFSATTRDLWVEPASGIIVDSREQVRQFFGTNASDEAVPVASWDLRYNDATVASMLASAQAERDRVGLAWNLGFISIPIPWLIGFFGLLTAVFGVLMGVSASRGQPTPAGEGGSGDDEPGDEEPGDYAPGDYDADADEDATVSLYEPHDDERANELDEIEYDAAGGYPGNAEERR